MGDDTITNNFRERLERDLDGFQIGLKSKNEANKPPPPPPPPQRRERRRNGDKILDAAVSIGSAVLGKWLGSM